MASQLYCFADIDDNLLTQNISNRIIILQAKRVFAVLLGGKYANITAFDIP